MTAEQPKRRFRHWLVERVSAKRRKLSRSPRPRTPVPDEDVVMTSEEGTPRYLQPTPRLSSEKLHPTPSLNTPNFTPAFTPARSHEDLTVFSLPPPAAVGNPLAEEAAPVWVTPGEPPDNLFAAQKRGLWWELPEDWQPKAGPDWEPRWQKEPDIEAIRSTVRPYLAACGISNIDFDISIFTEGLWNKLYTISGRDVTIGSKKEVLVRVSCSVFPWFKMQSEVATTEFVRHKTNIPVPRIYAFDSTMTSQIGYEWMLMEKIGGVTYESVEESLSFEKKEQVYKTTADWAHQLSQLQFDKIGSIYRDWNKPASDPEAFKIGPMVTEFFAMDLRLDYKLFRGPFASYSAYLTACVTTILAEILDPRQRKRHNEYFEIERDMRHTNFSSPTPASSPPLSPLYNSIEVGKTTINTTTDSTLTEPLDTEETAYHNSELFTTIPNLCTTLLSTIPLVLGTESLGPASTFLSHFDISPRNILLHPETHEPMCLLDWEMATLDPFTYTHPYPKMVDCEDVPEPKAWDFVKRPVKTPYRLIQEEEYNNVLLKRAFENRLKELESPWLRTSGGREGEGAERWMVKNAVFRAWSGKGANVLEFLRNEYMKRGVAGLI